MTSALHRLVRGQSIFDSPSSGFILTEDALGVHPEQDVHTVTSPLSNLCSGRSRVELRRDGGVAEVVWARSEWGRVLCRRQRSMAGLAAGAAVDRFGERATAG